MFLFTATTVVSLFDAFSTEFRATMIPYVRADLGVSRADFVAMFSWLFLGSCLSFVPRVLADVVGRKPMLIANLVGLCLLQWLLGAAEGPRTYVVLLILLALFYKSDLWLLVLSEEASAQHRGRLIAVSTALSGLGALALGQLVKGMNEDPSAWRDIARFPVWGAFGAIPLLLFMRETENFRRGRVGLPRADRGLLLAPFRGKSRRPLMVLCVLKALFPGGIFVLLLLLGVEFLKVDNEFPDEVVGAVVQWTVLISMAAWLVVGALADSIGRARTFYLFGAAFFASLLGLALLPSGSSWIQVAFVGQSAAATGAYAVLRIATMEVFSDGHRATGSAWTDLCMTLAAAGTARISGRLTAIEGVSIADIFWWVGLCGPLALVLYRWMPETRARQLSEVAD